VALWQLGAPYRRPMNQTLDEFLNATVESVLSRWGPDKWKLAGDAFYSAIESTSQIRGKHAFRKSAGAQQRKPINRGLFESELIVLGALNPALREMLAANRHRFEELFIKALKGDNEFIQALLYGTGSPESSNARIDVLGRIIKEAVDA
jgi:hypothetical protein